MNDKQFLLAIKIRAKKRPSNYQFVRIIEELENQARIVVLEKNIMDRFVKLCAAYDVELDDYDMAHVDIPRQLNITDKIRINSLHKSGFAVCENL